MERIVINVSGSRFEVSKSLLMTYPDTKLAKSVNNDDRNTSELYFDRSATAFESILSFYQTGKLHIPTSICPNAFKDELDFWQIPFENLDKCCFYSFMQFMDKYTTRLEFQASDEIVESSKTSSSSYLACKNRIWKILDYRENSWIAKTYFTIAMTCVLLSIGSNTISTLPQFRRNLTVCEKFDYFSFLEKSLPIVATNTKSIDCTEFQEKHKEDESYMYYIDPNFYDDAYDFSDDEERKSENPVNASGNVKDATNIESSNHNLSKAILKSFEHEHPGVSLKSNKFIKIDYFFTAYFTLEFILRLIVCPSFKRFGLSVYNGVELLILVGTYAEIALRYTGTNYFYSSERTIEFFDFVKFFRIIRLLRYCQNLAVVRVLKFSLCKNMKDLLLLFFNISFIVLIFANLLYLTERSDNINSIPEGWWLGVITITTVGFGDVFPKSVAGKIACSACALFGILVLALVTSIFVETFMTLYGVAQIETVSTKKRETWWKKVRSKIKSTCNTMMP